MKTLNIDINLCENCGRCFKTCPNNAIYKTLNYSCSRCIKYCLMMNVDCNPEQYQINNDICKQCLKCISVCKNKAIKFDEIKVSSKT